jgi:hypothetical protein
MQKKALRPKCRKLFEKYGPFDFLMDDKSYFTLSNSTLVGNDRYCAADRAKCSDEVRYNWKAKYESKLLVSVCISPLGISPIYFHHSKQAVNSNQYINILEQKLVPLVAKNKRTPTKIILSSEIRVIVYINSNYFN